MQAVGFSQPGGPEVLSLIEQDKPKPGPNELLIRVVAAGVNRPDCFQRAGLYPAPKGASDLLGLEVSGIVEQVGEAVGDNWKVGDAVCALTPGGGYAEYCVADAGSVLPVPVGVSLSDAALLPETYMTVWANVFYRAYAGVGESLLVHGGSSGIGTAAIQLAKAFDMEVITTVGNEQKMQFAYNLGADHVIDYHKHDFVGEVKAFTEGRGVDIVLDMVGGDYLERNLAVLANDGRHVSIALLRGARAQLNLASVMMKRLTLTGSTLRPQPNSYKASLARDLKEFVWPMFKSGKFKVPVDSVFPLADAALAHKRMESGEHMGKIMLKVSDG